MLLSSGCDMAVAPRITAAMVTCIRLTQEQETRPVSIPAGNTNWIQQVTETREERRGRKKEHEGEKGLYWNGQVKLEVDYDQDTLYTCIKLPKNKNKLNNIFKECQDLCRPR